MVALAEGHPVLPVGRAELGINLRHYLGCWVEVRRYGIGDGNDYLLHFSEPLLLPYAP